MYYQVMVQVLPQLNQDQILVMKNLKLCYSNKRNQDDFDKLIYYYS